MINNKKRMVKTYADTYLYKKYDYDKVLFNYLMHATAVDKTTEAFKDVEYEIKKRATSPCIVNTLMSNNIVLLHGKVPSPFAVLTAKDIKHRFSESGDMIHECSIVPFQNELHLNEEVAVGAPLKVFINVDQFGIMNGETLKNPEVLISRLHEAYINLIYYKMPDRLIMTHNLHWSAADAFVKLFVNIVDFLFKISGSNLKQKVEYIAAKYFYTNILQAQNKMSSAWIEGNCKKISDLTDREIAIINANIESESYTNINNIIEAISDLLRISDLTTDTFVERWMYIYGGAQTGLALEYYPSFVAMLTNAYGGCYMNNQKTIQKIVGTDMVTYSKGVFEIGG